jgi:hypothetical protein
MNTMQIQLQLKQIQNYNKYKNITTQYCVQASYLSLLITLETG